MPQAYGLFAFQPMPTKSKKKAELLKEEYVPNPEQGLAALIAGISKPGYRFHSLNRKGKKATIIWAKN